MSAVVVIDNNTRYLKLFDCKRIDLATNVLNDSIFRASLLSKFTNDAFKMNMLEAMWKNNQKDDAFMKFTNDCLDKSMSGFHQCTVDALGAGVMF